MDKKHELDRLSEQQQAYMEHQGRYVGKVPGLSTDTRMWEDRVKYNFYQLQGASTSLHQTMSADAVAAVLLESTTMIQSLISLLHSIGVGDKLKRAAELILDHDVRGIDRPNLLPLVLDKE